MRAWLPWIVALASGGCYRPSITACELQCNNQQCPDGLACNAQGLCAASATATCPPGGGGDAGTDAPIDGPPGACTWRPSNVDACGIGAHLLTTPVDLANDLQIDTETGVITPAGEASKFTVRTVSQPSGPMLTVVMSGPLTVSKDVTLVGSRPLVLLVNGDLTIASGGRITADFSLGPCTPAAGMGVAGGGGSAGGGGGGGYGTPGARGGHETGSLTLGGPATGPTELTPLRPGCPGGTGGPDGSRAGGTGGSGGGAIQLSSRGAVVIRGNVQASGQGGQPGSQASAAGGGGGGSGGSILIEGATIDFATLTQVCANGGGGGAGGANNTSTAGGNGLCVDQGAPGGIASGGGGGQARGGPGGAAAGPPGDGGLGGGGTGGGGGGGAVGRIRLNGTVLNMVGVITPMPTVGPPPMN